MKNEIEKGVSNALEIDDKLERFRYLRELKEKTPVEAFSALISLMESPDEKTRRRAAHALNWFRELIPQRADVLANHLERDSNSEVRLTCAILLMDVRNPAVDVAYAHAMADSEEKVAALACKEIGFRGGDTGIAALFNVLKDARPKVRLLACMALIHQEAADEKVVSTLEELRSVPVVVEFFKRDPEIIKIFKELCSLPAMVEFFKTNPKPDNFFEEMGDCTKRESFEALVTKASLMAKAKSRKGI